MEDWPINVFVLIRILLGCLFIVSGLEKLLSPYQNFLYVIQSYEVLIKPLEEVVARVLPWVEFFCGVFLFLGLWLRWSLRVLLVLIASFITIVSQAILRKLPISECGCFGQLFSLPLPTVVLMDSMLGVLVATMLARIQKTSALSCDQFFLKQEKRS